VVEGSAAKDLAHVAARDSIGDLEGFVLVWGRCTFLRWVRIWDGGPNN
jgi:hypothetical protein